jgi:hypothetical protein
VAANFPFSKDNTPTVTVGDGTHPSADEALSSTTGGPAHHALHQNVGLAIRAIEDKVGTGDSDPAANTVLTSIDSGTSVWGTVSTAMIGDSQVTEAKLAAGQVTEAKLAAGIPGVNAAGTQNTSGNAGTASQWANARTLTVDGDMTGDVSIDGSQNVTLTLAADLEAADIPDLSANKITSDTLHVDRIPDIGASKIDAGTFGAGDYTFPSNLTVTDGLTLGGRDLGEIVSFTPTWTNASGFQSNSGYYAYVKDLVHVSIEMEFSASVSVGSSIRVDLPVSASDTHQLANGMMQIQLFDYDEYKFYQGMTIPVDTNTVEVRYNIVVGNEIFGQPAGSGGPFTWADGDKILISGIYRSGS